MIDVKKQFYHMISTQIGGKKLMNSILEETTIEFPVASNKELETKTIIVTSDIKSVGTDVRLPSYPNIEGIEHATNHYLLAIFRHLMKFILVVGNLGTGRIDEQYLATRKPGLEAYHFRKDL
jgi:hypothetical protein